MPDQPLIYAGIDEAGYGPMLGPLCAAAAVFVLDKHDPARDGAPNLWDLLEAAVCRRPRDTRGRIAIDDSKTLKGASSGRAHPLRHLERGVLTFLDHIEAMPDDQSLFSRVGVEIADRTWYQTITTLPVGQEPGVLRLDAARLRRAMDSAGVRLDAIHAEAIDPASFNAQLTQTGNKARINLAVILRLVERIWSRWPAAHPRIIIDRQGGRSHYREDLHFAWPEASITIVAESDGLSRYRLDDGPRQLTVTFMTGSEAQHLPVALASMTAKYVRELMMLRLNRHFIGLMPELKPTAGYVQDGRRYLNEIAPIIRDHGIDRTELVRNA